MSLANALTRSHTQTLLSHTLGNASVHDLSNTASKVAKGVQVFFSGDTGSSTPEYDIENGTDEFEIRCVRAGGSTFSMQKLLIELCALQKVCPDDFSVSPRIERQPITATNLRYPGCTHQRDFQRTRYSTVPRARVPFSVIPAHI